MNIFLTGFPGVGKSTIIKKTLAQLQLKPSGFFTLIGSTNANGGSFVYIHPACQEIIEGPRNLIGYRVGDGVNFKANPQGFEDFGVAILKQAAPPLILMDELGFMEKDAKLFQTEVKKILNADVPVFGVLKPKNYDFLNYVRNHPKTKLIEVNPQNREALVPVVTGLLKETLNLK